MIKNLIPWKKNKHNEVSRLKDDVNSLFDRFITNFTFSPLEPFLDSRMFPSIDVMEGKKKITVRAEIPGVDKKDIDISLNDRLLTIKGEKKQEEKHDSDNFHRVEMSYGAYHRTIQLPAEVDPSSVDATYKKGVLKIELNKTKESDTRKIEIKNG